MNWNIQISGNLDESTDLHDVVKLLIIRKILRKYKKRDWIRLYTEFILDNKNKVDVYMENIKTKSILIYEIQKVLTKDYIKKKQKEIEELEKKEMFFKSIDLILIPLNECPENIKEINKWLDEYIT